MRILFVRHAEAVDAEATGGTDRDRQLTPRGKKQMKRAAAVLARRYAKPDAIYTSEARRARDTAAILAKAFCMRRVKESRLLNPGARRAALEKMLAAVPSTAGCVVVVGHEPDFSTIISALVADGHLRLKLKKGACAEVERTGRGRGILRAVVDPEFMGA